MKVCRDLSNSSTKPSERREADGFARDEKGLAPNVPAYVQVSKYTIKLQKMYNASRY